MRDKIKIIAMAAGILISALALLALLQIHRFRQLLIEVESARVSVPALALKSDIERTLAFGLELRQNGQLAAMLDSARSLHPGIVSIHLVDADLHPGTVLWQSGPDLAAPQPQRIAGAQRRAGNASWFDDKDTRGYLISWPVKDGIGHLEAALAVRFDRARPAAMVADAAKSVAWLWAAVCAGLLTALAPALLILLSRLQRLVGSARATLESGSPPVAGSELGQLAGAVADVTRAAGLDEARMPNEADEAHQANTANKLAAGPKRMEGAR